LIQQLQVCQIAEKFLPIFFFFLFCSCSGAVKKYPNNRMLGRRKVSDGKVEQQIHREINFWIYLFILRGCTISFLNPGW
jgi:hypothetical protein